MAMPPANVPASELFLKLLERPAPSEIVEFPRKGVGEVRVIVLPMEEHKRARLKAHQRLQKQLKETGQASSLGQTVGAELVEEVLGDMTACELIALAYHGVKEYATTPAGAPIYPKLFPTGEEVEKLTADEVATLFAYYTATQRKYGPHEGSFSSDEEVNAWIKRLEDGGSEFPLYQLGSHQLVDLIQCLALRAQALSAVIQSQQENSPIKWDAIPGSWVTGTASFGGLAAGSTPMIPSAPITSDDAKRMLEVLRSR